MLVDGHAILPSLLDDLRAAERVIHVSMFLFFRDPIGEEIAAVLCERARSGVRVRILLNVEKTALGDPFSTGERRMMAADPSVPYDPTDVRPLCEEMQAAGVEVTNTNIDYDAELPGASPHLIAIAAQIREGIAVDDLHVDHRKLIVIDGRVAYTGGANVGAQYMFHVPFDAEKDARDEGDERRARGVSEPWWKWHDSLTRFEGPVVRAIEEHFRERWVLDGGAPFDTAPPTTPRVPKVPRGMPLRSATVYVNEPSDQPNEVRLLYVDLIERAERSIFIENPYFYHPTIAEALVKAKERRPDMRVVLVLPAGTWNDNAFGHDAQQHYYARYLACGIEVYEYQHHFTHVKIAVFDGRWSVHGSTNLNYRSLEDDKDFELVVLVDDEDFARDILTRVRDVDVTHALRFTARDVEGSLAALRVRLRDPRTLLLLSRRML